MKESLDILQYKMQVKSKTFEIDIDLNKDILLEIRFNVDNFIEIKNHFKKYADLVETIFPPVSEMEKVYHKNMVVIDHEINSGDFFLASNLKSGECTIIISLKYEEYIDVIRSNNIYVPTI